jgi:hypothetical protein
MRPDICPILVNISKKLLNLVERGCIKIQIITGIMHNIIIKRFADLFLFSILNQ